MKRPVFLTLALLASATALFAPPAWWSEQGTDILEDQGEENNFGPANLGQLKHVAKRAKAHLDLNLLGGAGSTIDTLVASFEPRVGQGYTQQEIDDFIAENYSPINLGQLKSVAKPFYDRLIGVGYDTNANLIARGYSGAWVYDYPWDPATAVEENYAPANIGQLKMVFSFDVEGFDSDEDGLPDTWEQAIVDADPFDEIESIADVLPSGNFDGDPLSNLEEWEQESDPTDYYSQGSTTISPHISIVGGNDQLGVPDQYLAESLAVEVRSGSSTGMVLDGAPVIYTVTSGSGGLAIENGAQLVETTLGVLTGSNGEAQAWYEVGTAGALETITAQTGTASPVTFQSQALGANGLVGHWKIDEGSGVTAADSAPFFFTGTLVSGPTWSERYTGEPALSFSGTDAHVLVDSGTNALLDFEEASFSVVAWVKSGTAVQAGRIVSKGNDNANAGYYVGINANGQIETGLGTTASGTSAETIQFKTTGSFNDDVWHAVAAVYDRTNATAKIYVDGTAQDLEKEAGTGGTINVSDATLLDYPGLENLNGSRSDIALTISSQSGTSAFFKGDADDVRIYRKALDGAEIYNLRNIDSDDNGFADWWEGKYFGNLGVDPEGNLDDDGLSNLNEYYLGTNPIDADTDSDGLPDGWEFQNGFDPVATANDGVDSDGDGLTNLQEYQQGSDPNDYYSQGSTTITPVLTIASGDNQTGNTGEYLAEALSVEVHSGSSTGILLENAPVTYAVTSGGGELAAVFSGTDTSDALEVQTGTNGVASAWYRQSEVDAVESAITVLSGTAEPVTFTVGTMDLVGHWKLDEGSGSVAADSAPFEFTGTLANSPTWTERYTGEPALNFSGTDAHVLVDSGTNAALDFEGASFSVVTWVKSGTAVQAGRIVSKGAENANEGYYLEINASGQIGTGLGTTASGTSAETIQLATTGSFNDDEWHAVAAVYDRTNATARIYVDGAAQTLEKEIGTGGTINVSDATLLDYPALENLSGSRSDIALTVSSHSGTSHFFKGGADDVRLYRRALSAAEVEELFQEGGVLSATPQTLAVNEDALSAITLQHQGGGETTPVYTIVNEPANGTVELTSATANYLPNLNYNGADSFRFSVTKGGRTSEADINITVAPVNDPPIVSVGGGQSITFPDTLNLSATVTDVDTPLGELFLKWRKVSGPGNVVFTSVNALATEAAFASAGDYVLKFIADDGLSVRSDSLVVTVNPDGSASLPTISLEDPEDNASFAFGVTIPIGAEASASGGATVSKVEFYAGSNKIGQTTSPTGNLYEMSWTPTQGGTYTISAMVTDTLGGSSFSGGARVTVIPPSGGGGGSGGSGDDGDSSSHRPYVRIAEDDPPASFYSVNYNLGTPFAGLEDWYDLKSGDEYTVDWKREFKVKFTNVTMSVPMAFSVGRKGKLSPYSDPTYQIDGATEMDSWEGRGSGTAPNFPYTGYYLTARITDNYSVSIRDDLKKSCYKASQRRRGRRISTALVSWSG